MKDHQKLILEAGKRAYWWFLDTGDCLFCSPDDAAKGQAHQHHCTFYGVDEAALRKWLDENPMEDVPPSEDMGDDEL